MIMTKKPSFLNFKLLSFPIRTTNRSQLKDFSPKMKNYIKHTEKNIKFN